MVSSIIPQPRSIAFYKGSTRTATAVLNAQTYDANTGTLSTKTPINLENAQSVMWRGVLNGTTIFNVAMTVDADATTGRVSYKFQRNDTVNVDDTETLQSEITLTENSGDVTVFPAPNITIIETLNPDD